MLPPDPPKHAHFPRIWFSPPLARYLGDRHRIHATKDVPHRGSSDRAARCPEEPRVSWVQHWPRGALNPPPPHARSPGLRDTELSAQNQPLVTVSVKAAQPMKTLVQGPGPRARQPIGEPAGAA